MSSASRPAFEHRHVAMIIETSKIYGREILLGVCQHMKLHGTWSLFSAERGQDDPEPSWLATWKGDGIITRSLDLSLCRAAAAKGIPVVSLRHLLARPEFPSFFPDQRLIARRIIEHFIECGFRNFAYVGVSGTKGWERMRQESFVQILQEHGYTNPTIRPTLTVSGLSWEQEEESIANWLRALPQPVGVMVAHDTQGIQVLDACRRAGLRVPEAVAVVSVDNDPVLCDIATPRLSSLDQNVQKLGFEAAAALDKMMRGKRVEKRNYFTEPGQVVVRQSSDIIAVADLRLAKAVRFIRDNACNGIDVNRVAQVAGVSRRALETKFAEHLGRTPLEEMQEVRFRRVRQLLLETDYILPRVAEMAGFQYQEYLVRFFKKRSGMCPGQYRRKHRFSSEGLSREPDPPAFRR